MPCPPSPRGGGGLPIPGPGGGPIGDPGGGGIMPPSAAPPPEGGGAPAWADAKAKTAKPINAGAMNLDAFNISIPLRNNLLTNRLKLGHLGHRS
jgi:hypothetical protein